MGEAKRRRLAREAGRPWQEDRPQPIPPSPAEVLGSRLLGEYSSEGCTILVRNPESDRVMELARSAVRDAGKTGQVLVITGRPRSTERLLVQVPEGFIAAPLVGTIPSAGGRAGGRRRRGR